MRNRLLIVSDTAVSVVNGLPIGYEPVVKEVTYFSGNWERIVWIGTRRSIDFTVYSDNIPDNVKIVTIPPIEFSNFSSSLRSIFIVPIAFGLVFSWILWANDVHSRGPSHPALFSLLICKLFPRKIFWHKYAGSWIDPAPRVYSFQRKLLKSIVGQNIFGTINGNWHNQPANIISLENPCFSSCTVESVIKTAKRKDFSGKLRLVYIGGLTYSKGIHLIIEALVRLSFKRIESFTIVGGGDYDFFLKDLALNSGFADKIIFLGPLLKEEVFKVLDDSHALVIASRTEGFPKVISEAMLHGCIPVSSNVSCIGQYVTKEIGFLFNGFNMNSVLDALDELILSDDLESKSKLGVDMAHKFTYERYLARVLSEIFVKKSNIL